MSESVHKHKDSAPETVRVAILTISDTRTPETDTGGDIAQDLLEVAGQEVVERRIVRDEVSGIRNDLVDLLARSDVDAVVARRHDPTAVVNEGHRADAIGMNHRR